MEKAYIIGRAFKKAGCVPFVLEEVTNTDEVARSPRVQFYVKCLRRVSDRMSFK